MRHTIRSVLGIGAGLALPFGLILGCINKTGDQLIQAPLPPPGPSVRLTSVQIAGFTDTVTRVDVNGQADADATVDLDWSALIAMDGTRLPLHNTPTYVGELLVTAQDSEQRTTVVEYGIAYVP